MITIIQAGSKTANVSGGTVFNLIGMWGDPIDFAFFQSLWEWVIAMVMYIYEQPKEDHFIHVQNGPPWAVREYLSINLLS